MKLSEAIRLGSMLKPQGFGDYEADGATCALGAAMNATGILTNTEAHEDDGVEDAWPIVLVHSDCPVIGCAGPDDETHTIGHVIVHLNDDHEWTRERIADWIETLEAAELAKTQERYLRELRQIAEAASTAQEIQA